MIDQPEINSSMRDLISSLDENPNFRMGLFFLKLQQYAYPKAVKALKTFTGKFAESLTTDSRMAAALANGIEIGLYKQDATNEAKFKKDISDIIVYIADQQAIITEKPIANIIELIMTHIGKIIYQDKSFSINYILNFSKLHRSYSNSSLKRNTLSLKHSHSEYWNDIFQKAFAAHEKYRPELRSMNPDTALYSFLAILLTFYFVMRSNPTVSEIIFAAAVAFGLIYNLILYRVIEKKKSRSPKLMIDQYSDDINKSFTLNVEELPPQINTELNKAKSEKSKFTNNNTSDTLSSVSEVTHAIYLSSSEPKNQPLFTNVASFFKRQKIKTRPIFVAYQATSSKPPTLKKIAWEIPDTALQLKTYFNEHTKDTWADQTMTNKSPIKVFEKSKDKVDRFYYVPINTIENQLKRLELADINTLIEQPESRKLDKQKREITIHIEKSTFTQNLIYEFVNSSIAHRVLGFKLKSTDDHTLIMAPLFLKGGLHKSQSLEAKSFGTIKMDPADCNDFTPSEKSSHNDVKLG